MISPHRRRRVLEAIMVNLICTGASRVAVASMRRISTVGAEDGFAFDITDNAGLD